MNKNKFISGLSAAVLLVAVLFLAGCSKSTTTTTNKSIVTSTPTVTVSNSNPPVVSSTTKPTSSTTSSSTSAAGGTLANILGRAASIASMKYDLVTVAGGITVNSTVYVKKSKIRIESTVQGISTVTLVDGDTKTMYIYTPSQNSAIKMDISQAPQSAAEDADQILQYNPVILGTETLDGKACQVIQYAADNATVKMWLWIDRGLPVRVESTTSAGTFTTDFKNYDFSDLPDSMFELPAGVTISDFNIPTGIPTNLPTNLPTNFPTNLPSGIP